MPRDTLSFPRVQPHHPPPLSPFEYRWRRERTLGAFGYLFWRDTLEHSQPGWRDKMIERLVGLGFTPCICELAMAVDFGATTSTPR